MRAGWIALALGALAFALFAPTLRYGLVWDDPIILFEQLPAFHGVRDVIVPPANAPGPLDRYYRPVTVASLLVDDQLGRAFGEPTMQSAAYARVFHLSTTLIHALTVALVFLLGASLARAAGFARATGLSAGLFGAVLFAVHPIHVETVAWIVGRSDSLCALFGVASLVLYLQHLDRGGIASLIGSGATMFLSLLSKEAAVALIALVPLLDAARRDPPARRLSRATRYAPFAVAAVLYVVLRSIALNVPPKEPGRASGWSTVPSALGWYLVKAVWPPPQLAAVLRVPSVYAAAGLAGALVLAALAWWLVRRGQQAELALLALFVLPLAPALAVPVLGTTYIPVAERFLYLPTIGLCLLFGFALARVPARRAVTIGVAIVALAGAGATLAQSRTWRDQQSLWTDVIAKAPSAMAYHNRGKAFYDAGQNAPALDDLGRAIALDPKVPFSYELRGTVRLDAGDARGALADFDAALAIEPRFARALEERAAAAAALAQDALTLVNAGHYDRATIESLDVAIAADPSRSDLLVNRGVVHGALGQLDAALADFDAATRVDPKNAEAWYNRGVAHAARHDHAAAVADFTRTLDLDPAHADARLARARSARALGKR